MDPKDSDPWEKFEPLFLFSSHNHCALEVLYFWSEEYGAGDRGLVEEEREYSLRRLTPPPVCLDPAPSWWQPAVWLCSHPSPSSPNATATPQTARHKKRPRNGLSITNGSSITLSLGEKHPLEIKFQLW